MNERKIKEKKKRGNDLEGKSVYGIGSKEDRREKSRMKHVLSL